MLNGKLKFRPGSTLTPSKVEVLKMTNELLKSKFWRLGLVICLGFVTLSLGFINLGCARTVTPRVAFGEQMTVTVTLRDTLSINDNRYFLVLSTSSGLKVPLPYPDINTNSPEFIEPGMIPQLGTEEAYYSSYYGTWSGYIELDPGGYFLTKGPFVVNQTTTREPLSTLDSINKTISFSFRLDRIFGSTVPDYIYYDFVSVSWPTGQAKIPADHLTSTNAYIAKASGSIATVSDGQDLTIDGSLDIVNCKVEIE